MDLVWTEIPLYTFIRVMATSFYPTIDPNDPDEPYLSFISTTALIWIRSLLKYEYITHQETMNLEWSLYIIFCIWNIKAVSTKQSYELVDWWIGCWTDLWLSLLDFSSLPFKCIASDLLYFYFWLILSITRWLSNCVRYWLTLLARTFFRYLFSSY